MTTPTFGRLAAFGLHLAVSAVIFIALLALMLVHWYPGILFDSDGGWQGVRIVFAVDLVLGPLLTLVAFKPGKPGLLLDMICIVLLQAACLLGGVWVVYEERPRAVVHVEGHFYSMSSGSWTSYQRDVPDLSAFDGNPPWIDVRLPDDAFEAARITRELYDQRTPVRLWTEGYTSIPPARLPATARPRDAVVLEDIERHAGAAAAFLAQHGGSLDDYLFYPFHARYGVFYIAFRRASGELVGLVKTNDELERDR